MAEHPCNYLKTCEDTTHKPAVASNVDRPLPVDTLAHQICHPMAAPPIKVGKGYRLPINAFNRGAHFSQSRPEAMWPYSLSSRK